MTTSEDLSTDSKVRTTLQESHQFFYIFKMKEFKEENY